MPTASMVFLYHPPNISLDSSIFVSIFPSHREYSEKVFLKLAYTTYSWMGQYVLHVADSTLAVFYCHYCRGPSLGLLASALSSLGCWLPEIWIACLK